MKKLLLLPTFVLLALLTFAQGGMGFNAHPHAHGPSHNMNGYIPALPMSSHDFYAAKQTINSKSFDSSKLPIAEAIAHSNYLSSAQVREIAELFDFDSSRLKFAKTAFGAVVDPGNFYLVNDAFTFDSNIRDLDAYVRNNSHLHRGMGYNAGTGHRGSTTLVPGDGIGYNAGAVPGGGHCAPPHGGVNIIYGVSHDDFASMKRSVDNRSFDTGRLSIAKQMASTNPLSSRQVRELMDLFTFESTKLEFAKFAYHYVINPERFYEVNDAFTFSSSTTDLYQYINGQ